MIVSGSFNRDANYVPITTHGVVSVKSQTLSGSNATVATPLFGITGIVELRSLYAVVTTDLGTNHTAGAYRLNDQTAQVDITLSTGSTLSSFKAGSMAYKKGLVGTALTVINNSAGRANESTASLETFSTLILTKKTAAATNIEYVYATTETPTSGVLQHFFGWYPISADANVTVL